MKKHILLVVQIGIVILCFPIFFVISKISTPLLTFVFSLIAYWSLMIISFGILIKKDKYILKNLKSYFRKSHSTLFSLISFIPVIAVFFVAFIPVIDQLNIAIIIVVLTISLFNGLFEEVFWRGLVLSKYSSTISMIMLSTLLFTMYHFAFLFLPIQYDGGAVNLVGGAAFMGLIWMFVSKKTNNIVYSIVAHQFVNFFAFSSLFIMNGLL